MKFRLTSLWRNSWTPLRLRTQASKLKRLTDWKRKTGPLKNRRTRNLYALLSRVKIFLEKSNSGEVFSQSTSSYPCFKCGHLGHISKFCEKKRICLAVLIIWRKMRMLVPAQTQKPALIVKAATDFSCPVFQKKKLMNRIMATENIPFLEARRKATQAFVGTHQDQHSLCGCGEERRKRTLCK